MVISVVVTLLNEEDNVVPLIKKIQVSLQNIEHEIILVDDGSTDETVERIKAFPNPNIRLLVLNRNYGQTTAMSAGIAHARGKYIVTMDGDLQNDPDDIPKMLSTLKSGNWDVVAGRRANRKDGMLLRKIPSKIANAFIRTLTNVHLHDYGCTLKIFKRKIAQNLGLYGELHRFIPVLAQLQGAKMMEMDVKHHPRIYGQSKYGLGRTMKVISDLMLIVFFQKYFQRPIHLFGPIGLGALGIGSLINLYFFVLKLMGQDIWGRPLLILGITLVLGGIQFITFGIIIEVVMRVYYESQSKNTYNIRETYSGTKNGELILEGE
ncbi:glycosyltransferase family 2 protein [Flexithrix dorotheae]|uniref:glycosyltransferase family 2 protein n=1 Tax=Flexithrix dorotheae TaxID=70993 RepID=UPI000367426A|nr:glycosyltransferase family 2 protein [Flexithrix dorotheae]